MSKKPEPEKPSDWDKTVAKMSKGRWTPEQLAEIREENRLVSQNYFVKNFLPYLEKTVQEGKLSETFGVETKQDNGDL